MSHVTGDRVLETTITTGTGTISLAGAVSGYRAFSAVATVDLDTFYYAIAGGTQWEVGLGTRATSTTFNRSTITASSTGSVIDFAAGTKEVWMDIPARIAQQFVPSINPNMINVKLVESHAGSAVTYAVKTLGGNNPSAADPAFFVFGATDGTTYVRVVTAALSITTASGSTMGAPSGKGFAIWLAALDNSGTVELAVRNCVDQTTGNIAWFSDGGTNRTSTTVQAGGGDDLARVTYSTTARTNVPYIVLGKFIWTSLAAAGTWDASPATTNLYSPQMPRAGDVIQSVRASDNTQTFSGVINTFGDTTTTTSITPSSVAHMIRATVFGGAVGIFDLASIGLFRIQNTTQAVTVGPGNQSILVDTSVTGGEYSPAGMMQGIHNPSSLSAQTYTVQVADQAAGAGAISWGNGNVFATMLLEEIVT